MKAPITLEIIIHYYCNGDEDYMDSQAFREQSKMLLDANLLIQEENSNRKYEPNADAIKVYLDALLDVPFPKLEWVVSKNEL